jgi:hypothetical protein
MFKAHILVNEDTDVAAELYRIDGLAKKHRLDASKTLALMRNAEDVLSDLKKQDAETAVYGIEMAVKKSLRTEDYDIVLELQPRRSGGKKSGPFSWLLGK